MAYLVDQQTHARRYLRGYDRIGRLAYAADLVVASATVSKLHAICEWTRTDWTLKDVSTNGTWLEGKRLQPGVAVPLRAEQTFSLGARRGYCMRVMDLAPPVDVLVAADATGDERAMELGAHQLLPSSEAPELAVFYDPRQGYWCSEGFHAESEPVRLTDGCELHFGAQARWQLRLARVEERTFREGAPASIAQLLVTFAVSADEEHTQLTLSVAEELFDLGFRAHHYLLLNLARRRLRDAGQGWAEAQVGWVASAEMADALGTTVEHVNIMIHRLRKQMAEHAALVDFASQLVERRPGQLRLAPCGVRILKAGSVEASTQPA